MKKLLLFVTALLLSFTLVACGETEETPTPPVITGVAEGSTLVVKVGSTEVDLTGISAEDSEGNELDLTVKGNYILTTIGDYSAVIEAKDAAGLKTTVNVTISVIAETCEENPNQEVCKTDVDRARELYEGTIYNVDVDSNGTADWMEVNIELEMGFSYYGDVDEDNAVWMNVLKFMEKYPNITVTRNPLYSSGWEGGDDGLLLIQEAALLEGTLPDIFFNPKGAETYDKGMTLDMTPYIKTDEEAQFITENALSGMRTYDNEEIWGIPWQGVGPMVAVNVGLLNDLGITVPGYDWTYDDYENIRNQIGVVTDAGQCVFPGVIDWAYGGANYFDAIPNGYRGYNTITQRFDFARATNFGSWLEQVAAEAKRGWHYYDLPEADREIICPEITDSWTDGVRGINTIYLWEFNSAVNTMVNKGFEIDVYPFPIAPEGGETATYIYHDYYSVSKLLEADRVKAEAAFQLVKWLTFGEEGLAARWSLIDELNTIDGEGKSAFINGERYLMDFIQGWPITSNPAVLVNHPLVKGFSENSGGLDRYNFDVFKNEAFQYQLSNGQPYPRHIPAFASVANNFYPWDIKDQMRDEGLSWVDIAPEIEDDLNEQIVEFLQYYIGVEN